MHGPTSPAGHRSAAQPVDTRSGDHDRFQHYARKDDITAGYVTGSTITTICGKVFVPSRDPEQFPMCPDCHAIGEAHWGPEEL